VQERRAAFFAQTTPLPLQVIRHAGKLVGAVSHSPRSNEEVVEMGYYLHPTHQGKGVMRAAGRTLLRYAANEFGVRRVYASADVLNVASGRILARLARETATGDVLVGSTYLTWPVEKKVEGRSVVSPSTTWTWSIGPEEGYEV
jgi:L-amino acid N-acyltransferase YncA